MANNGPNTNKQQFFITYAKQPHLNNVYTVFGKYVLLYTSFNYYYIALLLNNLRGLCTITHMTDS